MGISFDPHLMCAYCGNCQVCDKSIGCPESEAGVHVWDLG